MNLCFVLELLSQPQICSASVAKDNAGEEIVPDFESGHAKEPESG